MANIDKRGMIKQRCKVFLSNKLQLPTNTAAEKLTAAINDLAHELKQIHLPNNNLLDRHITINNNKQSNEETTNECTTYP